MSGNVRNIVQRPRIESYQQRYATFVAVYILPWIIRKLTVKFAGSRLFRYEGEFIDTANSLRVLLPDRFAANDISGIARQRSHPDENSRSLTVIDETPRQREN